MGGKNDFFFGGKNLCKKIFISVQLHFCHNKNLNLNVHNIPIIRYECINYRYVHFDT